MCECPGYIQVHANICSGCAAWRKKTPLSAGQALRRQHREARDFHGQRAVPLLQRGAHEVRDGWGPHADAAVAASAFLAATVAAARAGSAFLAATVAAARAGSAIRRRNTAAGADLRALRCAGGSLRANGRYDGSDDECPWGRRRPGRSGAGRSGAGASTRPGTGSGPDAAAAANSSTRSSTSPRASRGREHGRRQRRPQWYPCKRSKKAKEKKAAHAQYSEHNGCMRDILKLEVLEAHARGLTPSDGACSSTDVVKLDRHNRVT